MTIETLAGSQLMDPMELEAYLRKRGFINNPQMSGSRGDYFISAYELPKRQRAPGFRSNIEAHFDTVGGKRVAMIYAWNPDGMKRMKLPATPANVSHVADIILDYSTALRYTSSTQESTSTTLKTSAAQEIARIKGFDEYTWGTYNGPVLQLRSKQGTNFTLHTGGKFGARLSSNGKEIRFVFPDLGLTKVFTVDKDIATVVYNRSKIDERVGKELEKEAGKPSFGQAVIEPLLRLAKLLKGPDVNLADSLFNASNTDSLAEVVEELRRIKYRPTGLGSGIDKLNATEAMARAAATLKSLDRYSKAKEGTPAYYQALDLIGKVSGYIRAAHQFSRSRDESAALTIEDFNLKGAWVNLPFID